MLPGAGRASFGVAAFQNQADGPVLQTVAVLKVQVASVGKAILGEHEQMAGKRPETCGIRLDDDLTTEVSYLDPCVLLLRVDLRDTIGGVVALVSRLLSQTEVLDRLPFTSSVSVSPASSP
ncbi:hypothetical protein ACWCQN_43135 [Streptomyces sp. NPDC001984]|uniref:hypothetical protein n=1 Tax=Streptomyces sp. NPDC002619 TaxID=3364655 RepID=UPI0036B2263D